MDEVIVVLIVGLRIGVPLAIPRFPIPAILAALVIDAADQTVLAWFDAEPANYQGYDKALDIYYLAIAYLSTLRNWPSRIAFGMSQFLWYYRLVGVVAFEFSGERVLLLIFPNTFEYFFIAYEAVRLRWDPARLSNRAIYGMAAGIWIGIKLPQEYWVHVAQLDFTDALSNPAFATLVVVGLVALALIIWWGSRRVPAADWTTSFAVDAHPTTVLSSAAEPLHRRFRLVEHPLLEKTMLTGLTVAVFSQFFEVDATVTEITLACGFIVVVSAGFSELLRRRDLSWSNSLLEFIGLLTVNWGILIFYIYVVPSGREDGELQVTPTFVMLGLLTLIVIFYDEYRAIRTVNTVQPELEQSATS